MRVQRPRASPSPQSLLFGPRVPKVSTVTRGSWSRNLELIILLLSGAQLHSGSWLLSGFCSYTVFVANCWDTGYCDFLHLRCLV